MDKNIKREIEIKRAKLLLLKNKENCTDAVSSSNKEGPKQISEVICFHIILLDFLT